MPARIPRVTRTEAIVLRHRHLADADRIVTLLTPARGKFDAVAKGVLRPRSKLAGHLEPLSHVEVLLAHGRTLDLVTQAQMIDGFPGLHADLTRLSTAMYLLELADRLTVEHAGARDVYELLLASLVRLARGDGIQLVTRTFELDLLAATGFRPEWSNCTVCSEPVSADRAVWSPLNGGVVCIDCRSRLEEALPIDATVLRVLRAFQAGSYEEAARIRLNGEVGAGLERVMHSLMRAVSERALVSAQFVADARRVTSAAAAPTAYTRIDPPEGE